MSLLEHVVLYTFQLKEINELLEHFSSFSNLKLKYIFLSCQTIQRENSYCGRACANRPLYNPTAVYIDNYNGEHLFSVLCIAGTQYQWEIKFNILLFAAQ
jgi:hypothetical protein